MRRRSRSRSIRNTTTTNQNKKKKEGRGKKDRKKTEIEEQSMGDVDLKINFAFFSFSVSAFAVLSPIFQLILFYCKLIAVKIFTPFFFSVFCSITTKIADARVFVIKFSVIVTVNERLLAFLFKLFSPSLFLLLKMYHILWSKHQNLSFLSTFTVFFSSLISCTFL